jgi:hypothetical protein
MKFGGTIPVSVEGMSVDGVAVMFVFACSESLFLTPTCSHGGSQLRSTYGMTEEVHIHPARLLFCLIAADWLTG